MSSVNVLAREVAAKIVFYGPGLSGKTTTLKKIYDSVRPAHRGEIMSLATEGDRTLFFDFLPVKVERVGDCSVRLALYTVPGQVFYNATRKLVLQGADGIVFVADSQPDAMEKNIESLQNLEENLAEQGIRLERFPHVFQWNKRDVPAVVPVEDLRSALNPRQVPDFETCATSGQGVLETLKTVTRLVIKDLRSKRVVPPPRPSRVTLSPQEIGLEQQLQKHLRRDSPIGGSSYDTPTTPAATPPLRPLIGHHPEDDLISHRTPPPAATTLTMGPASALAPGPILDYAKAADFAFLSSDYSGCVSACIEAVRRALSYAGEESTAAQGYLLNVNGGDLLKLNGLSTKSVIRIDDAAFALFVLLQALARLAAAGLPTME
jgi:signal recognition particle receptor subunit beta